MRRIDMNNFNSVSGGNGDFLAELRAKKLKKVGNSMAQRRQQEQLARQQRQEQAAQDLQYRLNAMGPFINSDYWGSNTNEDMIRQFELRANSTSPDFILGGTFAPEAVHGMGISMKDLDF